MPEANQITGPIPPQVLQQAETKVQELRAILRPYLVSLSDEERQAIPKVGNKGEGFLADLINFIRTAP